jgi:hypothetical protein
MALNVNTLRDLIDTKYAAINTDYEESEDRDTVKNGLFLAIAQAVVEHITTAGKAGFTAGQITGTDSNGDTHSALVASNGAIT